MVSWGNLFTEHLIIGDFERIKNKFNLYLHKFMDALKTYLSTAPVLLTVWMSLTAGMLIEMNRFAPDLLTL